MKGHSGLEGNDQADAMAKKGSDSFRYLDMKHIDHTNNLSFLAHFRSRPIESKFRNFIMNIFQTYYMTEWSFLSSNIDQCQMKRDTMDWDATLRLLKRYKGF